MLVYSYSLGTYVLSVTYTGKSHKYTSMDKLEVKVRSTLETLRVKVEEKFRDIDDVINQTSAVLSEWDKDTEDRIQDMHKHRDKEVIHRVEISCSRLVRAQF